MTFPPYSGSPAPIELISFRGITSGLTLITHAARHLHTYLYDNAYRYACIDMFACVCEHFCVCDCVCMHSLTYAKWNFYFIPKRELRTGNREPRSTFSYHKSPCFENFKKVLLKFVARIKNKKKYKKKNHLTWLRERRKTTRSWRVKSSLALFNALLLLLLSEYKLTERNINWTI